MKTWRDFVCSQKFDGLSFLSNWQLNEIFLFQIKCTTDLLNILGVLLLQR